VLSQEVVPPSRLQPHLPRDLETICLACLQKQASKRYASALALAQDLRRFLEGRPILARPVGLAEQAWRWCRRNALVAALLASLLLVLLGGLSAVTLLWLHAERQSAVARRETEKADHQRQLAEASFQQARQAVDEYFTRISENRLIRAPGLQPLRRE